MPLLADPETEWKPCRTAFWPAEILLPAPGVPLDPWGLHCGGSVHLPAGNTGAKPRTWPAANPARCTSSCRKPTSAQSRRETRLHGIRAAMAAYRQNVLTRTVRGYVYVERTQLDGSVRQGLVGMVDLEAYSYAPGEKPAIRPSESTVLSRIPPRVRIRRGAPLETPHVMMLADDEAGTLIEPVGRRKAELPLLYEGELMLGGGAVWPVGRSRTRRSSNRSAAPSPPWPTPRRSPPAGRRPPGSRRWCWPSGTATIRWPPPKPAGRSSSPRCRPRSARTIRPATAWPKSATCTARPSRSNRSTASCSACSPRRWPPAWPPGLRTTASRRGRRARSASRWPGPGTKQALALSGATEPLTVGTIERFLGETLPGEPGWRVDYIHGEAAARALAAGPRPPGLRAAAAAV